MRTRRITWSALGAVAAALLLQGCARSEAAHAHVEDEFPGIVHPIAEFGTRGSAPGEFNEPTAVAIAEDQVYIADCFNHRVQVVRPDGAPVRAWGEYGSAPGRFDCPRGIAVTPDGEVFVSDLNHRVQVFSTDGTLLRHWGRYGDGEAQLNAPWGLAVAHGRVAVVDAGNNRVQIYDLAGGHLQRCGRYGTGEGEFSTPKSVAMDESGNLYIGDTFNHRLQKLGPDCTFLAAFGEFGSTPGTFAEPSAVAWHDGKVFVTDQVNHRVQAMTGDGEFALLWGRHPTTPHASNGRLHYPAAIALSPDGRLAIVCEPFENRCQVFEYTAIRNVTASNDIAWWNKYPMFHYGSGTTVARMQDLQGRIPNDLLIVTEPDVSRLVVFDLKEGRPSLRYAIGGYGTEVGRFRMPAAKSPTLTGELLVADALNHRIQVFDLLTGEYRRSFGGFGRRLGEFNEPSGIALDREGNIFIADFHNHRVQIFAPDGTPRYEFGRPGAGDGEFNRPMRMRFDQAGERLFVVDNGNQRVQVFDRRGRFLYKFGGLPKAGQEGEGSFLWPLGVAIGSDGSVFVTDPGQQLVQKFRPDGTFLMQWGGWGSTPGRFYKPKGIASDGRGQLYVIDFGNHRGQIFSEDGEFRAIFGEGIFYPANK